MNDLTIAEQIKIYAARAGLSISDIARGMGKSPANLLNQLKRDDFRVSDLRRIADIIGYDFICEFREKS